MLEFKSYRTVAVTLAGLECGVGTTTDGCMAESDAP
jgi:hypothetical protein